MGLRDAASRAADSSQVQPPLVVRRAKNVAREVVLIVTGIVLYFLVRGLIDSRVSIAFKNAGYIIDVEKWAHIFVEPDLQDAVSDHDWLVDTANTVYIYGHWPVIAITLAWLLVRHRDEYPRFRNAILISGAIGLVIFATFPVAPPRFLPEFGFVDTVTQQTLAYRVLQPPAFVNQYAAVPSLHFGWNLLMGIAWAGLAGNRAARLFGWLMPPAMLAAIVLTANHYVLDGVIGGALAMFGLLVATWLHNRRTPRLKGTPSVQQPEPDRGDPDRRRTTERAGPGLTPSRGARTGYPSAAGGAA
ncbi:MAG TPA: phosphatase PAP2 family protein [Kribbella sp.]|nr:phosphatase PAP2 family protein [Kribbella sp.]